MAQFIETPEGFDIIINGKRHGTWRSKAEAKAGLTVEVERDRVREQSRNAVKVAAKGE